MDSQDWLSRQSPHAHPECPPQKLFHKDSVTVPLIWFARVVHPKHGGTSSPIPRIQIFLTLKTLTPEHGSMHWKMTPIFLKKGRKSCKVGPPVFVWTHRQDTKAALSTNLVFDHKHLASWTIVCLLRCQEWSNFWILENTLVKSLWLNRFGCVCAMGVDCFGSYLRLQPSSFWWFQLGMVEIVTH